MGREMPIKRLTGRLSSGELRRSARLAATGASGQLKQQLKPAVVMKKLWSTSWTTTNEEKARLDEDKMTQSVGGSGMNPSVRTASAVSSGSGTHVWTKPELQAFLDAAVDLAPIYGGWTLDFCEAIAKSVNKKCMKSKKKYVPLDGAKVKTKHKTCRTYLNKYKKEGNNLCVAIGTLQPNFGAAYAYPMDSSSGAVVGPSTEEQSLKAALKDLKSSGFKEMKKYAELLNDPVHLDVFWAHGCYGQNIEQKTSYLNDASGFRKLSIPKSSVQQEDRNSFIQFKRDALKFMIANRVESKPFSNHDLFVSSYLLEDKVNRDVLGIYDNYIDMRDFLLNQIKEVTSK